jgi:hypothetical protein
METGNNETVPKPDRAPDAVIKPGHAVWWPEMIFMHVHGPVNKMEIDQEDGSLCIVHHSKKVALSQEVKDLYDKWWYECFESKVLGGDSDE